MYGSIANRIPFYIRFDESERVLAIPLILEAESDGVAIIAEFVRTDR